MKTDVIYFTGRKCFNKQNAKRQFYGRVSPLNWEILLLHITDPILVTIIDGFAEQNGTLFFLIEGEMISVTLNLNHPTISN